MKHFTQIRDSIHVVFYEGSRNSSRGFPYFETRLTYHLHKVVSTVAQRKPTQPYKNHNCDHLDLSKVFDPELFPPT